MKLILILSLSVLAGCAGETAEGPETAVDAPSTEAPNGTRERPFVGRGTIQQITESQLVIAHETIPEFMSAMTMAFPTAEEAMSDSLEVGDEITFQIELTDEGYQIFSVEEVAVP